MVFVNNSTNINKTNNHLLPQIIEYKKDFFYCWKSRSCYCKLVHLVGNGEIFCPEQCENLNNIGCLMLNFDTGVTWGQILQRHCHF